MSFNLIDKNYNVEIGSFLYYLHEKDSFNIEEFVKLCGYIDKLPFKSEETKEKLFFIQSQTLRHIIYHFDPTDQSYINNLPENYWEYIEMLEDSISKYIKFM